jgi:hypothetical protein
MNSVTTLMTSQHTSGITLNAGCCIVPTRRPNHELCRLNPERCCIVPTQAALKLQNVYMGSAMDIGSLHPLPYVACALLLDAVLARGMEEEHVGCVQQHMSTA